MSEQTPKPFGEVELDSCIRRKDRKSAEMRDSAQSTTANEEREKKPSKCPTQSNTKDRSFPKA
jgi:hypothetical protein